MPTPEPIGRIRFTQPRAVYVREAGDVENIHSAVHGTMAVYTDSYSQAEQVMTAWNTLMTAFNEKVEEILSVSE